VGLSDISTALALEASAAYATKSGSLATVSLSSATGAQLSTTKDVQAHTSVTFNPSAGANATCTVALSPDNVTYSTLCVWTAPLGIALDGLIWDVACVVPAGWYIKLTVNAQAVLGTTTYY
jgi:hypothetical protein